MSDMKKNSAENTEIKKGAFYTGEYPNLLAKAGFTEDEINSRINEWFYQMFTPGEPQCIYGEDGEGGGFLIDTGNDDVRTEGQSYGMMMAVQMDRQDIFNKIWRWTKRYMWHADGKYEGYFAWSCNLDGTRRAQGPAPDGEEYFAAALFLASARWGDGEPPFDYSVQARDILRHCVHQHKLTSGAGEPMWDPDNYLIRFVPETKWTDPSYHLPHFYEIFARRADECDHEFWHRAADASRAFIPKAAHPETGLCPEYSEYDGRPKRAQWGGGSSFYSDAYRVAINIGLDSIWFGPRPEYAQIARNIQRFFDSVGRDITKWMDYEIDGTPKSRPALHPVGLLATVAAASAAILTYDGTQDSEVEKLCLDWMRLFFETPLRTDKRRYFDSDLCFFTLLLLSGRYRIW